uniref:TssC1 C-terminal domain-containing protein n=1 Tax=Anopheles coluzzii TaxID=1518534 RepID=A0A8W7P0Q6_ANOCL
LYDTADATANSRINARLPYIFLLSRIAHYLKLIQRENIGTTKDRRLLELELNNWVRGLVTEMTDPGDDLQASHPLRDAKVTVEDIQDNPGFFRVKLYAVPHFQVEGLDVGLSLVSQMPESEGVNGDTMKIDRPFMDTRSPGVPAAVSTASLAGGLDQRMHCADGGSASPGACCMPLFDQDALAQGASEKPNVCRCVFQDGVLIDTDCADLLPPTLTLAANLPADATAVTVMLALPQRYANGGNCLQPDERAERPVRYRQVWRDVQNQYGDDKKQVAVMSHELTLRLDTQDNGDYQVCPVVRLLRDAQGRWAQDTQFIPPLLSLRASPGCEGQLDVLMVQLRARLQRLMG